MFYKSANTTLHFFNPRKECFEVKSINAWIPVHLSDLLSWACFSSDIQKVEYNKPICIVRINYTHISKNICTTDSSLPGKDTAIHFSEKGSYFVV